VVPDKVLVQPRRRLIRAPSPASSPAPRRSRLVPWSISPSSCPCSVMHLLPHTVARKTPVHEHLAEMAHALEQGLTLVHFQLNLSRFCHLTD